MALIWEHSLELLLGFRLWGMKKAIQGGLQRQSLFSAEVSEGKRGSRAPLSFLSSFQAGLELVDPEVQEKYLRKITGIQQLKWNY